MVTTTPVTIEQAVAILGVSASTIRRRIRAGTLRVEEARRPQGVVWLVHLPAGAAPAAETATVDTTPVSTTATASQPAGEAIAAMIQATLTPIVAPLVAELAASRQANERLVGELRAENRALVARTEVRSVEPTTESPPPRSSSTTWLTPRRFCISAALMLVLIGVGVMQVTVALYSLAVQLAMPG